jgi:hypothetical protein
LHENILRQVFRFRLIAQGALDKIHEGLFVLLDQGLKRRTVTALNAQHQVRIRVWFGRHGQEVY